MGGRGSPTTGSALRRYDIVAKEPVLSGDRTIRFEFAYDGGKPGAGGFRDLFTKVRRLNYINYAVRRVNL